MLKKKLYIFYVAYFYVKCTTLLSFLMHALTLYINKIHQNVIPKLNHGGNAH